jgi:hypothetical protein
MADPLARPRRSLENELTHGVLAHSADTPDRLARLLAVDPQNVLGHAVRGFALCLQMRTDLAPSITTSLANARRGIDVRGASDSERALVLALSSFAEGRPLDALAVLDAQLARTPSDLLAMKLGHALHFVVGDTTGMRCAIDAAVASQPLDLPMRGFALGCQAFAWIESGEVDAGERIGRRAVELAPDDAWGAHAVAHALATRGCAREGIAWLRAVAPSIAGANNFLGHVAWHEALGHLALGDDAAAIAIYDARIVTHLAGDYRDVVNAVTLLLRLRRRGHDVRDRSAALADHSRARLGDHGSAFADLHYVLAIADHHAASARAFVESMRDSAAMRATHDATLGREFACDLADAIVTLRDGGDAAPGFASTRPRWSALGGSRIQREVFEMLHDEAEQKRGSDGA